MAHLGDKVSQWEQCAMKMLYQNMDGHTCIFSQCQKLFNNNKQQVAFSSWAAISQAILISLDSWRLANTGSFIPVSFRNHFRGLLSMSHGENIYLYAWGNICGLRNGQQRVKAASQEDTGSLQSVGKILRNLLKRAREMAQWLRALTVPPGDPGLVPSALHSGS